LRTRGVAVLLISGRVVEELRRVARMRLGHAVVLPITEEALGESRLFTVGRRPSPHVRPPRDAQEMTHAALN